MKHFQQFKTKIYFMDRFQKVRLRKMYCIKCDKYRKLKNVPKTSCIFDKILVLSVFCDMCGSKDKNF